MELVDRILLSWAVILLGALLYHLVRLREETREATRRASELRRVLGDFSAPPPEDRP